MRQNFTKLKNLGLVKTLCWDRAQNGTDFLTSLREVFLSQFWVCEFDVKIKEWGKYLWEWERRNEDEEGAINLNQ